MLPPELPQLEPTPNDPYFGQQWALPRIRALQGWNITHGDPGVIVAIIDSGYTPTHPDFDAANLWSNAAEVNGLPGVDDDHNGFVDDLHGWDWVDNDNAPVDSFGHGTHVLGTVAAVTGNGIGVSGIGRALTVAPLRILDGSGYGLTSDVVAALAYAMGMNLSIANLSLTTTSDNFSVHRAIQDASNAGLLIVAAAGNTAKSSYPGPDVLWPAAYPETVAVAATDSQDLHADFSNYGPEITVAAPGVDILSLYRNNNYVTISGTSMATPHVSALLGLLRSLRPDLAAADLVALMTSTAADVNAADHPGVDDYLGAGRIDMGAALLAASNGLALKHVIQQLRCRRHQSTARTERRSAAPNPAATPVEGAIVYLQILSAAYSTRAAPPSLPSAPYHR